MIVYIGPLVLGFILGFILGTRIRINSESGLEFGASIYLIFLIIAFIVAYLLGPFPYYKDIPLANGFIAAAIGIIMGKLLFGRAKNPQKVED
ncbi:MAG TPA: energy-converting hydrogenase B subunit J [Methanobacterium sp.]|jgi:energy-converting hydrogenase B subunit J|nr:energy-converting hydrogenase B subunit J [Methanobacterium sp.]HOI39690.1 energy-converting hydrogenase B subunit J [Methanobacterium sp.]